MGKGKGAPEKWVAVVKPGRIMFEMAGVDEATAQEAMELAAHKLPIPHEIRYPRRRSSNEPRRLRRCAKQGAHGTEGARERAGRADFPAALSAVHRPGRSGHSVCVDAKKDLARVKTLLRERELRESSEGR